MGFYVGLFWILRKYRKWKWFQCQRFHFCRWDRRISVFGIRENGKLSSTAPGFRIWLGWFEIFISCQYERSRRKKDTNVFFRHFLSSQTVGWSILIGRSGWCFPFSVFSLNVYSAWWSIKFLILEPMICFIYFFVLFVFFFFLGGFVQMLLMGHLET